MIRLLLACLRSFRLRCPHCRRGRIFRNPYAAHRACGECGLVFQRDEGDFWGGMVFSYTFAAVIGLGTAGALLLARVEQWETLVYSSAFVALASILVHFPFAKSLWIHLLYATRGQLEEYRPPRAS